MLDWLYPRTDMRLIWFIGARLIWFIGALVLWWSVSTVICGAWECLPYVVFFYSLYAVPVVLYLTVAEVIAWLASPRWKAFVFMVLAVLGFAGLVAVFKFAERYVFGVPYMIFVPTAAAVTFYLIIILRRLLARRLRLLIQWLLAVAAILEPLLVRGLAAVKEALIEFKNLQR